jgi:SAM-dependent methyltransferase
MSEERGQHWEEVYRTRATDRVSWFRPHLDVSIDLLKRAGLGSGSRVIDIGAGASTLVDDLLALGVRQVTALDLSAASLGIARSRLGADADRVEWIVADVTSAALPPAGFDLWHDRAAFHFLVEDADVGAYVQVAARAVRGGGHVVIGQFAADGPSKCSGLPVARRDPEEIAMAFSPAFTLVEARRETHVTPGGTPQSFAYALLRRAA